MEAAAARAFSGVSGAILQALCDDIRAGAQETRAESVLTLIKAHSDKWGWSEWDVAEAMMPLLSKELKEPQIPMQKNKFSPVLERVAAMGEVLRQRQAAATTDALGSGAGIPEHTCHVARALHVLRRRKLGRQKHHPRGSLDILENRALPWEPCPWNLYMGGSNSCSGIGRSGFDCRCSLWAGSLGAAPPTEQKTPIG